MNRVRAIHAALADKLLSTMTAPEGFVDLDRRFHKIDESDGVGDIASQSYLAAHLSAKSGQTWDELLQFQLVVILGEPGSGKTWELRTRCDRLLASQRFAFHFELERLALSPFAEAVSASDAKQLRKWQRSRKHAWFFLDSVDESKIRRSADFHTALAKLRDAIGESSLDRANFVISSRFSEWQWKTDRGEVLAHLTSGKRSEKRERDEGKSVAGSRDTRSSRSANSIEEERAESPSVHVVGITPLDRERVQKLVISLGIAEPQRFLTELNDRHAWEFARRPIDVVDLVSLWGERGRLGTLTEMIEHDVTVKLRETAQRQNNTRLTEQRARVGAEQLAAAVIFCRQLQFKIPDDAVVEVDALDAAECLLPDWLPNEVTALLSRPLFDGATYGRVRFHHRRVSEYLASRWLANRMAEGCPIPALLAVLFEETRKGISARKSLIPVAAWLCVGNAKWNEDVRSNVLKSCPDVAFQYGDPSAFTLNFRRSLLRSWVERNTGRERLWTESTAESLRRLADPSLAAEISARIDDQSLAGDVREKFVEIARWGRLAECAPSLLGILRRDTESDDIKIYALAALRDIGAQHARQEARTILLSLPSISERVCSIACDALFPGALRPDEISVLLTMTGGTNTESPMIVHHLERLFEEDLQPQDAASICQGFIALLQSEPHVRCDGRETRISSRYRYLLDVLPVVIQKTLSSTVLTELEVETAAEAISLLSQANDFHRPKSGTTESIDNATRRHPSVRRATFWRWAAFCEDEDQKTIKHPWHIFFHQAVLHVAESDKEWLIRDAASASRQCDQELATRVVLDFQLASDRKNRQLLQTAVATNNVLAAMVRDDRRSRRWRWLHRFRIDRITIHNWRSRWRRRWHRVAEWWNFQLDQLHLLRHLAQLNSASKVGWLADLCHEATTDDGTRLGLTDWEKVKAKRGRHVANAAKRGCEVAWRQFVPDLPHEKSEPSSIPYYIAVGITGISAFVAQDGFRFESFSANDAELATRYAVNEMNGFPAWTLDLALAHVGPVTQILERCVRGEWLYPASRENVNDVLADLAWQGSPLADLVRPAVFDLLSEGDPVNAAILDSAVSLLLKTSMAPDTRLAGIAMHRCQNASVESATFAIWFAIYLQVDAIPAIELLERRLSQNELADDAVLRICGRLDQGFRARFVQIADPDFHRPAALRRLIPLVFRHLPPSLDIERRFGGSYRPTDRDDAARFRDGLIERLASSDDREATELLRELVAQEGLVTRRDWMLHLLDLRAATDAEAIAWQPADVRAFATNYETDPKTDGDLFRIVCNRIDDIKHGVERSDNSSREEVEPNADEYVLRRFLARKLVENSRSRYTVPQETEIDREQRPDIRVEHPATAPVSIEVKWADNWTLGELLERLETQLVGQYLRSHRARDGVYFLGYQSTKQFWLEGGSRFSFSEVVEKVAARARELVANRADVEQLQVISIDFTRPT